MLGIVIRVEVVEVLFLKTDLISTLFILNTIIIHHTNKCICLDSMYV